MADVFELKFHVMADTSSQLERIILAEKEYQVTDVLRLSSCFVRPFFFILIWLNISYR